MNINGKSQWEFCCEWYSVNEIADFISRETSPHTEFRLSRTSPIPNDIHSRQFAEWLAHQYRLAMNKGIEIAERAIDAEARSSQIIDTPRRCPETPSHF